MGVVLILSGGMDSTTLLAVLKSKLEVVRTLTFNYGSKHNERENYAADLLSTMYGVANNLISLPFINKLFDSDLLKSGEDVPSGHYTDESQRRTVVPFRNGIMLSIAVGFAESIGFDYVAFANHAGDHAIYPDCRERFVSALDAAAQAGTYLGVKVISPFLLKTKTDIVQIGYRIGVPYHLTYSCYRGGEKHCGTCGTCVERKEAFRDAGVIDPTEYLA
jgi:7-cyano-7-deazaguanine synthase